MATKSRCFTGLVYPDSAPEGWKKQLEDSLQMWLISPLHEPDKEPESIDSAKMSTGKPHWHVMYCHGNTIAAKVARELFPSWVVTPPSDRFFMVTSMRNLSRYFLHLDQHEKQQFQGMPDKLLTALNGFPLDLERELTHGERLELKKQLHAFVRSNNVTEYAELLDALADSGDWDLFELAFDSQSKIEGYIRSQRNRR